MSDVYTPTDFGVDPTPEEVAAPDSMERAAIIRTSDRIAFKKCRRRWAWSSHLKGNLGPKEAQNPLWFGTGMHYALEDFHGYNFYGSPVKAFKAYCMATKRNERRSPVPTMFDELQALGLGMMEYYADFFLVDRTPYKTFWYEGKPQCEVKALIKVPFNPKERYPDSPYDSVYYQLTIDRVVEDDETGELWLLDYKSAKQMQTHFFLTDPQIGVYYWAGQQLYPGKSIKGFIYQQHRKDVPEQPKMTARGKLSTDKRQLTTHRMYRHTLKNIYGEDSAQWPPDNIDMLNHLAAEETMDMDKFVRRDRIYRNNMSHETEGVKILLELEDMLNPDLPLYPNPTRDCMYMCPFMHACVSMDDGSDWEEEIKMLTRPRGAYEEGWRQFLPDPEDVKL